MGWYKTVGNGLWVKERINKEENYEELISCNSKVHHKKDIATETNQDIKGTEITKKTNQRDHNFNTKVGKTNALATIATIVVLLMVITPLNATHKVRPLSSNQTFYFDPVAKAQLVRDKWTLIVFYDMGPYWEGIKTYNKITQYLNRLCGNIEQQSHCNMILSQLAHEYKELDYYNELLLTQHFDVRGGSRRRRGLVDAIGHAQNYLFGVLDSNFADQYTKDIETARGNEKHLLDMWKNQTSLIESEFNLMKSMQTAIDKQHKTIDEKLKSLEENSQKLGKRIIRMSDVQDFILSAMAGTNLLQSLKRLQEILLDTITDIYHGQISLHLLTPKQLHSELEAINSHTADDVKLPIQNIDTDFHYIYGQLKVKARVTQKFVIFEVTFPLISREEYQLYKLVPIPHQMLNDMVTAVPVADYIAVNLEHDSYFTVTTHELDECLYHGNAYMCDVAKPILRLEGDENFCDNSTPNYKCRVERSLCTNRWVELNETSKYLYFFCEEYHVQVICNDQITPQRLDRAGIIKVSPECIIKGKDFSLYSRLRQSNQIEISPDIFFPEIDQINNIVNLTFPTKEEIDENDLKTGFTKLAEKIESVKTEAMDTSDGLSFHDIHQYTVSYGLLAAVVLGVAVWWTGCCHCKRKEFDRQYLMTP